MYVTFLKLPKNSLTFLVNIFLGKKIGKGLVGFLGTISILISFLATLFFFTSIQSNGKPIEIKLFEWITLEKFSVGFSFLLDNF